MIRQLTHIHDRTSSGGPLRWLSVVDEFTRECLVLEVAGNITAQDVMETSQKCHTGGQETRMCRNTSVKHRRPPP